MQYTEIVIYNCNKANLFTHLFKNYFHCSTACGLEILSKAKNCYDLPPHPVDRGSVISKTTYGYFQTKWVQLLFLHHLSSALHTYHTIQMFHAQIHLWHKGTESKFMKIQFTCIHSCGSCFTSPTHTYNNQ